MAGAVHHLQQPRTRAECVAGPRPCPWRRCRYHLQREVSWALQDPSCALDLADDGPMAPEDIARAMGISELRVRRLTTQALRRARHVLAQSLAGGEQLREVA